MNKEQVIALLMKTEQAEDFEWTVAKLMKRDLQTLISRLEKINKMNGRK